MNRRHSTKKSSKCVECRYCGQASDNKGATRHACSKRKQALPANVTSRPACSKFKGPAPRDHWGA